MQNRSVTPMRRVGSITVPFKGTAQLAVLTFTVTVHYFADGLLSERAFKEVTTNVGLDGVRRTGMLEPHVSVV